MSFSTIVSCAADILAVAKMSKASAAQAVIRVVWRKSLSFVVSSHQLSVLVTRGRCRFLSRSFFNELEIVQAAVARNNGGNDESCIAKHNSQRADVTGRPWFSADEDGR